MKKMLMEEEIAFAIGEAKTGTVPQRTCREQ